MPLGIARDAQSWERFVKAELEKIPSVSEIEFALDGGWVGADEVKVLEGDLPDDLQVIQPGGGTLTFEVTIPLRVQEGLFGAVAPILDCTQFRLITYYEFEGPATIVRCLEGDLAENDPSDAVFLVREFLENELRTRRESRLKLVTVGPSPFHANFSVVDDAADLNEGKASPLGNMLFERRGQLGYAEYLFHKERSAESVAEFARSVPPILARQLAFFYSLSVARAIRIKNADVAERAREELVKRYRAHGLGALLYRLFRSGRAARNTLILVIELENTESRHKRQYENGLREFESQGEEVAILGEMKEAAEFSQLDDLKSARETVVALDEVRKKEFEVAVVSLSTLLGAAAGAVASLLSG
ncbi:hypothetical protein [Actinomycetospora chibensis]|uniref:Uncharacterized protein n=1 Tax=Actinomycetospora chibensis TaxID=663606 RepID=A0ABV9RK73_9PSEU|nr:hypothetical protein [Actinomycetospora chibensis]MDD7923049.1 hypothetical protein [Actinomycetospora chibensis]